MSPALPGPAWLLRLDKTAAGSRQRQGVTGWLQAAEIVFTLAAGGMNIFIHDTSIAVSGRLIVAAAAHCFHLRSWARVVAFINRGNRR